MNRRLPKPRRGTGAKAATTAAIAEPTGLKQRRRFGLLAAVTIPLLVLLAVEAMLRLAGYGYAVGFFRASQVNGQRTWIENPEFGRRFFPPSLARGAQPFTIPAQKPTNTVRIFVLGESAAMGDPDLKFGLPRMLEVLLRERYPAKKFEVINAAVVAINSHVILPIAQDCAKRQGDLWVLYMGNNEVIGPFGSASVFGARAPALPLVRAGLWLKTARLGQLLDSGLQALARVHVTGEWRGMEMMAGQQMRHDSPETQRVYRHFQRNLNDILDTGAGVGVPIVLCTVPTNLKDCAPFASAHKPGLTTEQLAAWHSAYDDGRTAQAAGDWTNAIAAYERAGAVDGDFAELSFRRAQCCEQLGQAKEAGSWYLRARDVDALQFRADTEVNNLIRAAGTAFNSKSVELLDTEALLTASSPQQLPGREYFYEHVHLTPEGNYLIARAIAERAARALRLESESDWISQGECFRLLGLMDWNRYDALNTILERIQQAPFTQQLDHPQQLARITEQLDRFRPATKPAQIRRQATQVAQLVNRYPQDADLRWNLAALLQDAGDSAGAEQQWRTLLRLQPRSATADYNLARLLEVTERQTEALSLYRACLKLNRDFYAGHYALGKLLLQMGRPGDAIQHLKVAVRQKPDSEEARQALTQAYRQSGGRGD